MPALFSPRSNLVARWVVVSALLAVVGVPLLVMWWVRTPPVTGQGHTELQPVPLFSHQIHVTGLQIDCRYCHYTVERAAAAGMPSSTTCLPCHNQVWRSGAPFAPIRASLASGRPVSWLRINRLPDYVFFNHAIHVNKGVGCETCHGRVDQMAVVRQAEPLTMSWCLDCHTHPERYLRPVEQVTAMGWHPVHATQLALGRELKQRYHVQELTTCTACHR
jgi:Cytochrome c7 and related cytochrome c